MFGAPVGGIDRVGVEEKCKDGWEFDGEMRGKAAPDLCGTRLIDERVELVLQMTASDCETVRGHELSLVAVADLLFA